MRTVQSLLLVSSLSLATAAPALAIGRAPGHKEPVLAQARAIAMLFPFQALEDAAHALFPFWPEQATPAAGSHAAHEKSAAALHAPHRHRVARHR